MTKKTRKEKVIDEARGRLAIIETRLKRRPDEDSNEEFEEALREAIMLRELLRILIE